MCWKSPGEKKRLLGAATPVLTDTLAIQVGRRGLEPSSTDASVSYSDISHAHCLAASWCQVRDMMDSWDQRRSVFSLLQLMRFSLPLFNIWASKALRGMKESNVFKTCYVSGSGLNALYILIHVIMCLLWMHVYIYWNPHFIGAETADEKAEVIWVRLPEIWT